MTMKIGLRVIEISREVAAVTVDEKIREASSAALLQQAFQRLCSKTKLGSMNHPVSRNDHCICVFAVFKLLHIISSHCNSECARKPSLPVFCHRRQDLWNRRLR